MANQNIKIKGLDRTGSVADTDDMIIDQSDATRVVSVGAFIASRGIAKQTDLDNFALKTDLAPLAVKSDLALSTGAASIGAEGGGTVQQVLSENSDKVALVRSDLLSTDLSKADALITVIQPYPDFITRTQHDKNAEFVTATDAGAKGDSVTNDTSAFQLLESHLTGREVDLLGKTYLVDTDFNKNNYFNGALRISGQYISGGVVTSYTYDKPKVRRDAATPITNLERDVRQSMARQVYNITAPLGLQSLAFDEPNGIIYGTYFDTSSGAEQTVVAQYSMGGTYPEEITPTATSLASPILGHQGFGLEYVTNQTPKLWSCGRYDATDRPQGHNQAVRFNFVSGSAPVNIETFTLFGPEFAYTGNATMVCISYEQRYLVAAGRKNTRDFWVRVFDLNMLTEGGSGDYSDEFMYEFQIDAQILTDDSAGNTTPVQNLACDGAFIYVIAGNSGLTGKKIHQYTLAGHRVSTNNTISVGLSQATSDGTFFEPEGLAFYTPYKGGSPRMVLLLLSGNSANRRSRLWEVGQSQSVYSDVWTPTLSNVTNISDSTAYVCQFSRIGNMITFSGRIAYQTTAAGQIVLRMSLPVYAAVGSLTQAQGVFASEFNDAGRIQYDQTTNTLEFVTVMAAATSNRAYSFTGSMRLVN